MKKLMSTLLIGATIGTIGCSTKNLSSQKYEELGKSTQYSLENILPDEYKSMELKYLGTIKRGGAGDSYRTNSNEFVVTALYQDKNRELGPEERKARENTVGNLLMKFQKADYDLMVVYQVCDGNIDNKKPVMIYAPHDGKGATWSFKQPSNSEGMFHNRDDLRAKILKYRKKFNAMKSEEAKRALQAIFKPTFANCGREIEKHQHGHGGGHDHGKGHKHGGDHHGAKKRLLKQYFFN